MFCRLTVGAFAACVAAGTAGSAHASAGPTDVTISTAPTHNMALNNGVYSPTGNNAVLNVNDLTSGLNVSNLEVTTGTRRGDIDIEAAFHWVSANTLTLDAFHSIRVDQPVTDAGAGVLTLTTNDGGANGHLEFSPRGNITFWGLSNALTINGKPYTLVNSVASLAAAVASAGGGGNYALAANYDASIDKTYQQSPVVRVFKGNFEGLGHTISSVTTHGQGFFTDIDRGASVSDFHLRNTKVSPPESYSVGGLAAQSDGTLYGDDVSGMVVVAFYSYELGGLIGSGSGSIMRCSSSVAVKARGYGANYMGGLVGQFSGTIVDSFATTDLTAGELTNYAGGLVGDVSGHVLHSHATGRVEGARVSGSLQGLGGLAGSSEATISDSYATGDVATKANLIDGGIGGLVGLASNSISGSFATGKVEAWSQTPSGGLVGADDATIVNSYATGAVVGNEGILGGLMGILEKDAIPISNSYATGKIDGNDAGGFSYNNYGDFSNDDWDMTTSETTNGTGSGNVAGITGLTTTQLQSGLPAGFDPKIWAQDRKINRGFPYLIANPPPQ